MNKIGILSGTFDPIHKGHVLWVNAAMKATHLDEVVVIVERQPILKRPNVSLQHRLAMTRAAFINTRVTVRSSRNRVTQLTDLTEWPDKEIYLLVGSDTALQIPSWLGIHDWAEKLHVVIGLRTGAGRHDIFTRIEPLHFKSIDIIDVPLPGLASSDVRRHFELIPPNVAEYIEKHQLYRALL